MCDCCFESSFEIILESEPQTIMFKKVGSFEKGGFYEITKSDKWYHDFNIFRFREVEEISNDFMFNYNFFVSAESSDECFGQSKEVESLDTMISGRGSNLFYTISSCSEPIPFVKVTVFDVASNDSIGKIITGKETDFNGKVAFHLKQGKKILEFRSQEYSPFKDTIEIKRGLILRTNLYLSRPSNFWEYEFSSARQLTEEKVKEIAGRIFLEDGISPSIKEEYPFIK
jgi:hypothetical protein